MQGKLCKALFGIAFFYLLLFFNGACSTNSLQEIPFFPFAEIAQQNIQQSIKLAEPYNQKTLYVRGFLFQTKEGLWILSAEPNLKSCCIGRGDKAQWQIQLPQDFEGTFTSQPVVLKGRFKLSFSSPFFALESASLQHSSHGNELIWLGIAPILIFVLYFFLRKN